MSEIKIKKPKRSFRIRDQTSQDSESDTEDTTNDAVEEMKNLQKLRKRPRGVNIDDLASIKAEPKEKKNKDLLKLNTGGYVDIKALKREISKVDDIEQIGTSFAVETNRRDEDADMLRYVEEELARRKGVKTEDEVNRDKLNTSDSILYALPEHLQVLSSKKKTEDMLSNQMLSGIPEVDLGIECKIKNIEQTEEAKQRLIQERMNRKEKGVSDFVPTNMAVNFVQHNRFNVEENIPQVKPTPEAPRQEPLRVGDADKPQKQPKHNLEETQVVASMNNEKATDDFHYEKFKKHMRRF